MAARLLGVGDRVRSGQEVGRLQPRLSDAGADRAALVAAVAEAEIAVDAARADLARAERLLAERAVPGRRVGHRPRLPVLARAAAQQDEQGERDGGGTGRTGHGLQSVSPRSARHLV